MVNLAIYLFAFFVIWIGAGLVIRSVERFAKSLKLSSFAVSFLLLGFFTSLSELSVGVNSVIRDDPEIYVGNLIGASIVIFMLIVPLLAIVGRTLVIQKQFRGLNLALSLIVIAMPVLLAIDGEIDWLDSVICIASYIVLAVVVQKKKGLLDGIPNVMPQSRKGMMWETAKILVGVFLIFGASNVVVQYTEIFSAQLGISEFLLSLLLISIGTNLPELSLVVRSAFSKNKDVAFGDYVGSASVNTFLLGALTLVYGKPIVLTNSYVVSLLFLIVGLGLFYWFCRSSNKVSRGEGVLLLMLYIAFLMTELLLH